MGCRTSKDVIEVAVIESNFDITGNDEIDELFKELSRLLQVAENCRQALMNYKKNGYEFPSYKDEEKVKLYVQAFKAVPGKLENIGNQMELQQTKILYALNELRQDSSEKSADYSKVKKIVKSNLNFAKKQVPRIVAAYIMAEEASGYCELYTLKEFLRNLTLPNRNDD